jgi:hypothetical protein
MLERPQRPAARRRAADRQRQRRCRDRRRRHCAAYQVEANGEVLNMLVRLGYLRDADVLNARKVSAAITQLLIDSAADD